MALIAELTSDWAGHPLSLLIPSLTLLLAFCALKIVYNLFVHPLRRFPGPFLARISKVWIRIGNFNGCKSRRIHEAHQRYGTVVRIGPNELAFSDPAVVREIYTSKSFAKEESFYGSRTIFHENHLVSFRNVEAHHQRRKMLARGFSQSAMTEFEPSVASKIRTLLDQWANCCADGSSMDIYPWTHWLGFDVVYHLMFDADPGTVKAGRPHEVMKYMRAWRPTYRYKELVPSVVQWGIYIPGKVGGYFRDVKKWKQFATNIVRSVRGTGTKTPFLSTVLNGEDGYLHRPLTDSELAEECMGGMFGGSGTTANTFIYIVWACFRDREVIAKLKAELKATFPDRDAVPDYLTCTKLRYLQAVISETLRRYPTIIATLPRTALEDVVIGGLHLPKGTTVGMQNYTIHRDASAFPEPEEFRPERWLDEDGESDALRKQAFTPFSVGPRRCIGMTLAEMELSTLTAAFFRRFDGEVDPLMREEDMWLYDTFNAAPTGGKLVVKLREEVD